MKSIPKVKTAIVGCGMISHIYIRNLKELFSIIDLVAVCDIYRTAAEEKATQYGVECVMTLDEIAANDEIELIVNLTPPKVHYEIIKRMLEAGKHVFTEKVLTDDLKKGRELVQLAQEKGLYLGVAPDTVLGAGIQTARYLIDHEFIGRVTSFTAAVSRNQSLNSESFKFLRDHGGALPYDVGIYYIAALLCLLGPVSAVKAYGQPSPRHEAQLLYQSGTNDAWTIPGNNLMAATLRFQSGVVGTLLFDGNAAVADESVYSIYGTHGMLHLGDPNRFDGCVKLTLPESGECVMPHTHGYNGAPVLSEPTEYDYSYGHRGVGAAEMAWAIRMGRPNRCSKEYGLHCMEILWAMDESSCTGKEVEIVSNFIMEALPAGFHSTIFNGVGRGDAERSLTN